MDAYYGEASELIYEYFQVLRSASKGKHFPQYSTVNGLYDTNILIELKGELDSLWEAINSIEYADDSVKERVDTLYRGYTYFMGRL